MGLGELGLGEMGQNHFNVPYLVDANSVAIALLCLKNVP